MRNTRRAGILAVAATAALLVGSQTAGATDDLDCGDPGTSPNMSIDPNNDPHRLDDNNNGIGCEDPSVFEPEPSDPEPSAPPTPEPQAPSVASPAQPVERQPSYTG